jgi:hypothetical protein
VRLTESSFLVAALALHAVLPVIAHIIPAERPLVARSFRGETEFEIEVTPTEPLPVREVPREPERAVQERAAEVRPDARVAARDPSSMPSEVNPAPTSTAQPETQPAPTSSAAPAPTDSFDPVVPEGPPGPGGIVLAPGIGGRPAWSIPGVVPESTAPAPAPTTPPPPKETRKDIATAVITQEMAKKDKALGLDLPAAGTVASAIGAAVRSEDTPNEGRATFEVRLGASGQVLGVRLVSSSAGAQGQWERAAKAAAAKLAGRSLTMSGAYAAGATVYVDVSSAMLMPDGSKTGGIKRQGAGASFDVANIGARPSRVVRTGFRVVASK